MVSTRLIRSRGSLQKQMSMDQDLLVCVVSERSKLKKMTQWNRQPKDDEEPGIEPNLTETETPVGGQRIPPQNPGAPVTEITALRLDLGAQCRKTSCHQGASPHPFPGLSTGGLHSNINPFASVSCTQRQSSRQSSTTAPSPQYSLFGGGTDRRVVAARANAATAGGRQDGSIAGRSSIR